MPFKAFQSISNLCKVLRMLHLPTTYLLYLLLGYAFLAGDASLFGGHDHSLVDEPALDGEFSRRLVSVDVSFAPDMRLQSKGEKNYLKLHKCRDNGEAYSAAYLISREHIIYQNTAYNLTWVNCEMVRCYFWIYKKTVLFTYRIVYIFINIKFPIIYLLQ